MSLEDLTPAQQQQLRLGQLLLEKNPEIAERAKELALEADPNLRLPEVTLARKIAEEAKKRQELEDKLERQRIEDRVAERERAAKKMIEDSGFSVEEIEKIVKDEELHGNGGLKTALKLAQLQREAANPGAADVGSGGYAGPRGDIRGDPQLRKMNPADLRRWSADEAHKMLDEFKRSQRGARGNGG